MSPDPGHGQMMENVTSDIDNTVKLVATLT